MCRSNNFVEVSEEKATEEQKEKLKELLWTMRLEPEKPVGNYSRQEAEDLIKTLEAQYEEIKVGQVEIDKKYNILKMEKEGEYIIASKESNYKIKPKERWCECQGFLYDKHCKHLDHERFVDFWTKLGEYITAPVSVQPLSIEEITEAKLAENLKFILGDDVEKGVVIHKFPVRGGISEMLSAEAVTALGNFIGIDSDADSEIKQIENTNGHLLVIEAKGTARFRHPRGHFQRGTATVMQILNIEDLGHRGTDLTQRSTESKAKRKAILRVLPITESGIVSRIKKIYGWK